MSPTWRIRRCAPRELWWGEWREREEISLGCEGDNGVEDEEKEGEGEEEAEEKEHEDGEELESVDDGTYRSRKT